MSQLEYCIKEWSTGIHVPAGFYEKLVREDYAVNLGNVGDWVALNLNKTTEIREKWYRRAAYVVSALTSLVS
jgi:hypothetical protein